MAASPAAPTVAPFTTASDAFLPIDGYKYVKVADEVENEARKGFESEPEGAKAIDSFAVRSMTKDGEGVAVVMTIAIKPEQAAVPGFKGDFVKGFAESTGKLEPATLGDEDAHFATNIGGLKGFLWTKGTLVLIVMGQDRTQIEAAATALVDANKGRF